MMIACPFGLRASKMLDRMKDLGFKISTKAGMTVGIADILTLEEKHEILEKAH
ncbi:hypothetical protein, partial [Listeria monocytogenes]|uniref:hypothetical protein n=1 Tax=Listeria monocytogenes TaxID=1639 RepID=UPI001F0D502B